MLRDAARTLVPVQGDPHGPLPPLLLVLTFVTGLVDAVSFLTLGHVFVANMTGNVVFLGFALAGAGGLSLVSSLVALASFLLGAVIGGRLANQFGGHRGRLLTVAAVVEAALVAGATVVAAFGGSTAGFPARYVLITLLAIAMGVQNAALARRLGVPDMTTSVLTLTLTGLAADSRLAGGEGPRPGRRLLAVGAMFAGALLGGLLVLHTVVAVPLAVASGCLLLTGLVSYRLSRHPAPWTRRAS